MLFLAVEVLQQQRLATTCREPSSADGKQGLGQLIFDYAKRFVEDKIKRPSAEDLLVEEDIKLLPKVTL